MCAQIPDGPVRGVQGAVCREQGLPPRLHLPPAGQPRQVNSAVIQGHYINPHKNFTQPTYMTGLLHEGKFHVGDLLEPAIFDSLPWAYVMCNWAQILLHRRH